MNEKISERLPGAIQITSRTNPLVTSLAKLDQTKHRREQQMFLAEGIKLSQEAEGLQNVQYVILKSDDGYADSEILDIACAMTKKNSVIVLPETTFQKISTENAPQGIITVLGFMNSLHRQWKKESAEETDGQRLLIVDSVRDPGNLGTMIRTAAAFGYKHMLIGGCADIYHPKTVRASMGALFRTQIDVCESLPEALYELKKRGHRIVSAALAEDAVTLGTDPIRADDCIVIGNEGHGVSEEVLACSDTVIKIPMEAGAESLNAAGAAAVLMWEYYRSFR